MRLRNVAGSRIDPDVLVRPPSWTKDAACIGTDPETWFPKRGRPGMTGLIAKARAICHTCPVEAECLDFALTLESQTLTGRQGHHSDMAGIFGGLTVHERQDILRERHAEAS